MEDVEEEAPPDSTNVKRIFGKPYTVCDVFRAKNEQYIKMKTMEKYGVEPGGNLFVGRYQQMIMELFNQFKEDEPDELKEVKKEVEIWNRRKPPKEEQQKYVLCPPSTHICPLPVELPVVQYKLNDLFF